MRTRISSETSSNKTCDEIMKYDDKMKIYHLYCMNLFSLYCTKEANKNYIKITSYFY